MVDRETDDLDEMSIFYNTLLLIGYSYAGPFKPKKGTMKPPANLFC